MVCYGAWQELKLHYDYLWGTSVGALNGLMFHAGDLDKLESLWMNIESSDVYTWNPMDLTRPFTNGRPSIYDSSPLLRTIRREVNYQGLYNNHSRFYVTATDYYNQVAETLEYRTMAEEDLVKFVYASASPPILFPPVEFEGKLLVDGGLTSNYNIQDAVTLGAGTVVLFSPTYKATSSIVKNVVDMVDGTISIATHNQLNEEISFVDKLDQVIKDINEDTAKKYKQVNLIVIEPDKDSGIDLIDFDFKKNNRKDLIAYGYDLAKGPLKVLNVR